VGKPQVDMHLLNVQEADPSVSDLFSRDAADVAERVVTERRDSGTKLLASPAQAVEEFGVRVARAVLLGDPATVIGSYADNHHCDMVVMGTRGLSPVSGLFLGSVTTRVVHSVKVPVTLVK
jgi:nucleotide-binding universal stress UspA family protein